MVRDLKHLGKGFDEFVASVDKLATPKFISQGPLKNNEQSEKKKDNLEVKLATIPDDPINKAIGLKDESQQSTYITLNDKPSPPIKIKRAPSDIPEEASNLEDLFNY